MFIGLVLLDLFIYSALPSTPIAILAESLQWILLGEGGEVCNFNFLPDIPIKLFISQTAKGYLNS